MPRRSIRHLVTALLILTVATLSALGTARPAIAATPSVSIDKSFLYLNVAPDSITEATINVTAGASQTIFPSVNAGWLTLDQLRWQGSRAVQITATARGMAPGEMRAARIQFASNVVLPVVLAVGGPATPPPMVVFPSSVDFGTLPAGQSSTYYLNLALTAPDDISITADADWIDVTPKAITAGTSTVISVRPVLQKVTSPQQYNGTIEVRAGSHPPVRIPATLQVASSEAPHETTPDAEAEGPFMDVPAGHWAQNAIAELAAGKVINGVGDGKFAPDDTVTREQFAKLLVLAFGLSHKPKPSPFADVADDRWSATYIMAAAPFMARYSDGLFHPEIPAMREEIAVALTIVKGLEPAAKPDLYMWFTDYTEIAPSAQPWVATARAVGLLDGFPDGTFRPTDPVTRAQVAVLFQRSLVICSNPPQAGCAAPLGETDRTLAGATLKGPRAQVESTLGLASEERPGYANSYTLLYRNGQVTTTYLTPSDTVWSVLLQGEGATPRGIKIGDSLDAVRKAYGPQGKLEDGVLTYRTGAEFEFFYIQFFFVDGKVHSILLTQSK